MNRIINASYWYSLVIAYCSIIMIWSLVIGIIYAPL